MGKKNTAARKGLPPPPSPLTPIFLPSLWRVSSPNFFFCLGLKQGGGSVGRSKTAKITADELNARVGMIPGHVCFHGLLAYGFESSMPPEKFASSKDIRRGNIDVRVAWKYQMKEGISPLPFSRFLSSFLGDSQYSFISSLSFSLLSLLYPLFFYIFHSVNTYLHSITSSLTNTPL